MRDPFAPVRAVASDDPAVLFDSIDARAEYVRTRDPALFKVREGSVPCVFVIQPASGEVAIRLDHSDGSTRALLAFRACVHRVELPSGDALVAKCYESTALGLLADESWVSLVTARVGPRRVREIAEAAYRLSMLEDCDPLSQPHGQPPPS